MNKLLRYRRMLAAVLALLAMLQCAASGVEFSGGNVALKPMYSVRPTANTGLNAVYVLYDASGMTLTYTASDSNAQVKWYTYGSQGGGYAVELGGVTRNGAVTTKTDFPVNCGYIIEEGTTRTYFWVVNYADYRLQMQSVEVRESDADCSSTTLTVAGVGNDIDFYSITGVRNVLSRGISVAYNTLVWSEEGHRWEETAVEKVYDTFRNAISVQAPLCNTSFVVGGDTYLRYWNEYQTLESDVCQATAVDVHTSAEQAPNESANKRKGGGADGSLGGSAPAVITFVADCTDAVTHKEWQMSYDRGFNEIEWRLNEEVYEANIEESGTTYWRFVGSNASGECVAESEVYTVNVGESELLCPNAFSPLNQDGVNDEWKVSYSSIVEFECTIFNRWGVRIVSFKNPDEGWDGRYKGKFVKPGAYYYVIKARGADGKDYKLSGDINIVGSREAQTPGAGGTQE